MAAIVLVHGIGQQQASADTLERDWLPDLAGGIRNAGFPALADRVWRPHLTQDSGSEPIETRMAFYGNRFLTPGQQGTDAAHLTAEQLALADELALEWLANATHSTHPADAAEATRELNALTHPTTGAQGLKAGLGRAVAALDRIPWLTRAGLSLGSRLNPVTAQVTRYLTDDDIRGYVHDRIRDHLAPDTIAIVAHSLGSVAAYEVLRDPPVNITVPLLVTLGSPLGLSTVHRRLQHPPAFPAVHRWVNLTDRNDIVAARPHLQATFNTGRPTNATFDTTYTVDNGSKPHNASFYLTKHQCGRPIAQAFHRPPR